MATDKITTLLEQQLKTLGQKVRLDILRVLYVAERPLTFSELQRRINVDPSLINLSYHLNSLKDVNLIESPSKKYSITSMGQEILNKVFAIKEILTERNNKRMIRTSQYSKESFDPNNIETYLMREAQMNSLLAEKIAKIVRERLSKTKIEYLTTPLMREYINGILIEEGCEEYRHRLTRLGVPPFDTSKMFNNSSISANSFIKKLGGEVSEQYLLLNLLPRELADLYLSKKIIILNLDTWALKPLSIIANTRNLLHSVIGSTGEGGKVKRKADGLSASLSLVKFIEILNSLGLNCSNDLLIYNFDDIFSLLDLEEIKMEKLLDLLYSHMRFLNDRIQPSLDLAFNLRNHPVKSTGFIEEINRRRKSSSIRPPWSPNLFLNYSQLKGTDEILPLLNSSTENAYKNYIFYNGVNELVNSVLVRAELGSSDSLNGQVILDKIIINLYQISMEANQNDEIFFKILEERLRSCFEFFSYKQQFLEARYKTSDIEREVFEKTLGFSSGNWLSHAIKSISFIGLNESVKEHCGIELDRIKESEDFALDIINFMKERISERNHRADDNFRLTQPHEGQNIAYHNSQFDQKAHRLIREPNNLNLRKKINLFKRISQNLDGGSSFELRLKPETSQEIGPKLEGVLNSKLPVFHMK